MVGYPWKYPVPFLRVANKDLVLPLIYHQRKDLIQIRKYAQDVYSIYRFNIPIRRQLSEKIRYTNNFEHDQRASCLLFLVSHNKYRTRIAESSGKNSMTTRRHFGKNCISVSYTLLEI